MKSFIDFTPRRPLPFLQWNVCNLESRIKIAKKWDSARKWHALWHNAFMIYGDVYGSYTEWDGKDYYLIRPSKEIRNHIDCIREHHNEIFNNAIYPI